MKSDALTGEEQGKSVYSKLPRTFWALCNQHVAVKSVGKVFKRRGHNPQHLANEAKRSNAKLDREGKGNYCTSPRASL